MMLSVANPNQSIALTALAVRRQILVYYPEYYGGKFGNHYIFGPNYRAKFSCFLENIKKEALDHVLQKSQISLSGLMSTIGNIEVPARAAYAEDMLNDLTRPEFQNIMLVDGCFFLLLAFSILGAGAQLKFPENHLIFGTGCVTEYMDKWLESLFLVGNQIPFIVLEKLMELSFFQELKTANQWKRPLELAKRTLYQFLMVEQDPKPVDLIHCLQSTMLGAKTGSNVAILKKDDDIEDIPSARKLSERGVRFQKLEGDLGIRGIHYECNMFGAVLYLPMLKVDNYTMLLVKCLIRYETVQEPRGVEPEASSFFKFMGEFIRSRQDIEVLESQGIIQGQSQSLLGLQKTLDSIVLSGNLQCVKREIGGNHPWQWKKPLKWIVVISSILMFFYALMQMNYGILSYYKGKS